VVLQHVSGDSRQIFFTTSSSLVDGDTNGGADLYRYTVSADPARPGDLTLISTTGTIFGDQDGTAVIGSSEDGSRVYYQDDGGNLYLWDHGRTVLVSNNVPRGNPRASLAVTDSDPGAGRVSPDGRYLAYLTSATPSGHTDMFFYDANTGGPPVCVSCPLGQDATADAGVAPDITEGSVRVFLLGLRPRFLAADGRVFFSTAEALVPADVNGVEDVYEYDPATKAVQLLSTGVGAEPATFVDASTSGNDVFLATRQQLVRSDRDSLVDLYDIRVRGGFPEPLPAASACVGDACQGAPVAPPQDTLIGTVAFAGATRANASGAVVHLRLSGSHAIVGSAGILAVRLPTAGRLTWAGTGVRSGSRGLTAAKTFRLRFALSASARRRLIRAGRYRTTLRLSFTPSTGSTARATASLTFTTTSKKGR
jgi:hypothetical protein